MGNKWIKLKLKDIATFQEGYVNPSQDKSEYFDGPVKWLRAVDLNNGFVKNTSRTLSEAGFNSAGKSAYLFEPGTLAISKSGTIGRLGILQDYMCGNRAVINIKVDGNKYNILYVYYFLLLNRSYIENLATGSVQKNLYTSILGDVDLLLPPLEIQDKIVGNLICIDKKIEINRQINQTLEQMAQTLFKSWFVDFDPVIDNALDAGNEIPEPLQARAELRQKIRASQDFQLLPADVRVLFPAEFEESELGCVPKGWELLPVSKAILINPSVKLTKGTLAKFADMKALPTTGYSVEGIETKPYSGGAKFQKNDVLLARITPCLENGKTGFVDFLSEEEVGFGSTEFVVLRATKKIHFGFVACLARDDAFRAHAIQSMVGSSGRQRVQNSCFDAYQIAVPEQSVMSKFSDLVEVSFSKMTTTNAEIASLSQLRDTLLPKLISGELRLDEITSP